MTPDDGENSYFDPVVAAALNAAVPPGDFPPLGRGKYWKRLGREHGRRRVPSDGGGSHPAASELLAELSRCVHHVRGVAGGYLAPVDGHRMVLFSQREELGRRRSHAAAASPPTRRVLEGDLARLDETRARLDVVRRWQDALLVGRLAELRAEAERADAVYRTGYVGGCRVSVVLEPVDFTLPAEIAGPLPDPVPRAGGA